MPMAGRMDSAAGRVRRALRGLASLLAWRRALTAAGIAVIAGALAAYLAFGHEGEPRPAPDASPATSPTSPLTPPITPTAAVLRPCTAEDVIPMVRALVREREVFVVVYANVFRPCKLAEALSVRIAVVPGGTPLPIEGNPASVRVDYNAQREGTYPFVEATWTNWCGESDFYPISATLAGKTTSESPRAAPPCLAPGRPSQLTVRAVDPDAPPPLLPACDPAGFGLSPAFAALTGGVQIDVYGKYLEAGGPSCRLTEPIQLTVLDARGQPLSLITNGATASVDAVIPSADPIARFLWGNWCGEAEPPYRLQFVLRGHATLVRLEAGPACTAPGGVSKLEVLGPPLPPAGPRPTPAPIPGGLRPVTELPGNPTVWIYRDAQPTSTKCTEIVGDMVPAAIAGQVEAKPFTCTEVNGRLRFASDGSAPFYLLGVQLLLLAKNTLPQPSFGAGTCDSIREHLVPASEPLSVAAYVLVCDVQPRPRGQQARQPLLVWGRIVADLAPPTVPQGAPCWSLTRYLGLAGEARTVEVQCFLE